MECLFGFVNRSTIYELWCPALYFSSIMSKRHRVDKKLETKYKALVELAKGKSNKEVAQSFSIPPNTLSTLK